MIHLRPGNNSVRWRARISHREWISALIYWKLCILLDKSDGIQLSFKLSSLLRITDSETAESIFVIKSRNAVKPFAIIIISCRGGEAKAALSFPFRSTCEQTSMRIVSLNASLADLSLLPNTTSSLWELLRNYEINKLII